MRLKPLFAALLVCVGASTIYAQKTPPPLGCVPDSEVDEPRASLFDDMPMKGIRR